MAPPVSGHRPPSRLLMTRILVPVAFWLAGLLAIVDPAGAQQVEEYQLKAAVLYHLASFVVWPEPAVSDASQPFVIGVLGSDPFKAHLDALERETVAGRPVQIRRFADLRGVETAHILFVGASEDARLSQVLAAIAGRNVLTVGEAEDFATDGGIIRWYIETDRLRFEVNRCAAALAGLKISSRILRFARITPTSCAGGMR